MGRPHRIDPPGGWHHVVNRGAARRAIFFSDRDRVEFERLLGVAHHRFGMRVHAFCFMTNHYHLLVSCPEGGLSDAMHLIASTYVRWVNKRLGRDGPMFRDRFFARSVADDAYLARLVRYIHRNPLAFVAERELSAYRWSSLRVYAGRRSVPRWMHTQPVLDLFGGSEGVVAAAVQEGAGILPAPNVESVRSAVSLAIEELAPDASSRGLERTISTLLLCRSDGLDGMLRDDLEAALGSRSPDAWRAARSRALRSARADPTLDQIVDVVLDLVA